MPDPLPVPVASAADQPAREFGPPPPDRYAGDRWTLARLLTLLKAFGPSAIAASVSIGAGETILVVRAGAQWGYQLLWLITLSCLLKGIFVTYLLGRYTVVCGEPMADRLARLPGPRGWLLLTVLLVELITAPLYWTAIGKPCGVLLIYLCWPGSVAYELLPGLPLKMVAENLVTSLIVLGAIVLGYGLSYQKLEREQVILCGLLILGTLIGSLLVFARHPDIAAVLGGLVPAFPTAPPCDAGVSRSQIGLTMATLFAYVGNTVLGYVVYANWVGLHGWGMTRHPELSEMLKQARKSGRIDYLPSHPKSVQEIRSGLLPLKCDVALGSLVLLMVSASFLMAGAAVLHPRLQNAFAKQQEITTFAGWSLLTDQAYVWNEIHPWLVWVYYVVIFVALWGTLQAFPEIYLRVAQGFSHAVWPDRPYSRRLVEILIAAWLAVSCLTLIWTNARFEMLTELVGFLTNNLGVTLMMFAALYLDRQLPVAYRIRPLGWYLSWLTAAVLMISTSFSGWGLGTKLWNYLAGTS